MNMNNIKKIEAWERIQRRYIKSEQDVEETISKIGNDLRKDRAFVIAFAKVRKSIELVVWVIGIVSVSRVFKKRGELHSGLPRICLKGSESPEGERKNEKKIKKED